MPPIKRQLTTAFGTYTLGEVLGEGGSGRVYRATDDTGASVAVKVLDPAKATREKRKRFKNEILFGHANRHARILRIIDYGVTAIDGAEALFCVMPLYPATLRARMQSRLDAQERLRLFGTLLDGVETAHLLGVIHRDLKPENILFDQSENGVVVGDFGAAHFEEDELYTLVETKPGTRLANFMYAAPEQRLRGQTVGRSADIYALGLILNELFTGEVPQGTGYRQIQTVSPELAYLDDLVAEMIRQQPRDRPQSIDAVKMQLIARKNDFIGRQRLSELSKTVVPDAQVDDPLVIDPIRVVALDVANRGVTLKLNRSPNQDWIALYRDMTGVSFFMGNDFRQFPFQGSSIQLLGSGDHEYQQLIDQVKAGIQSTNVAYAALARRQADERVQADRARLQSAANDESRRLELRKRLTI